MISTFSRRILESLRRDCRVPDGATIVVGASGGADSTALLASIAEARTHRVIAAHLDHAMRPGSERDASFVRELATRLGVEHREERLEPADANGLTGDTTSRANREDAGRRARYAFLLRVAREKAAMGAGPAFVAVGHIAEDVLETQLIALLRGAGPRGFSHPRPVRQDGVVRPLLAHTRREILDYLAERGLDHVEDPTNADGSNLRARLRRDVVPLLVRENPEAARAAVRASRLFAGLDDAWTAHVRAIAASLETARGPGEIVLDAPSGRPYDRHVLSSVLREIVSDLAGARPEIGCEAMERIADAWRDGARHAVDLPGGIRVRVEAGAVRIGDRTMDLAMDGSRGAPWARAARELGIPGRIVWAPFGEDRLDLAREISSSVRPAPAHPRAASGPEVAWLDAQCIEPPLVVRSRTEGDRYRPMGLEGSAKVQDILTDRKIPRISRDALPVVADVRGILWIPGLRVDERARITDRTTQAICVEARPLRLGTE
jgi:tRNA(Ile)-lysidine synthase